MTGLLAGPIGGVASALGGALGQAAGLGLGGAVPGLGGGLGSSLTGGALGAGLGGGLGGSVAAGAAGAVLHGLLAAVLAGVGTVAGELGGLLGPQVDTVVGQRGFLDELVAMRGVAEVVVAPLLFIATAGAVLRRDGARLARAWCALPVAVLATAGVGQLVGRCCEVVDWMDGRLLATANADPPAVVSRLLAAVGPTLTGLGGVLGGLLAGVTLLAMFFLWLELAVRGAAIVLVAVFLPLVFATAVWPPLLGATRRALEVLAGLIVAKFVVVAALVLGVSVLGSSATPGQGLVGVGILLLSAFAPVAVLRVVPLVETAAVAHLEGRARQPLRAAAATAGRAHAALPALGAAGRLFAPAVGGAGEGPSAGGGATLTAARQVATGGPGGGVPGGGVPGGVPGGASGGSGAGSGPPAGGGAGGASPSPGGGASRPSPGARAAPPTGAPAPGPAVGALGVTWGVGRAGDDGISAADGGGDQP